MCGREALGALLMVELVFVLTDIIIGFLFSTAGSTENSGLETYKTVETELGPERF
jgi:hypothetical protein